MILLLTESTDVPEDIADTPEPEHQLESMLQRRRSLLKTALESGHDSHQTACVKQ